MKNMNEIYIWHHLGLGDHCHCNALVRNVVKNYDKVYLFVKKRHRKNIEFMYRDLSKINFIDGLGDQDEFVEFFVMTHPEINLLKIGFNYLNKSKLNFDEAFYEQAGLAFYRKFDDFYIQRDTEAEEALYKEINPTNEPYVFIHQDKERGFLMNLDYIQRKDLKIIESEIKYPLFLLGKTIENATEVHCMESSIKNYIDCFLPYKDNMYFHKYMRKDKNGNYVYAIGRNYWKLIE